MSIIALIRHGQASFGSDNYDQLSALGERQATLLGPDLIERGLRPDRVIAGSLKRQQDTAALALKAAGLDIEVETDPCWDEFDHQQVIRVYRPDFTDSAAIKAIAQQHSDPNRFVLEQSYQAFSRWQSGKHDADYSESWSQFQQRVGRGLAKIEQLAQDKQRVWVVSSGGAISAVAQQQLGCDNAATLKINWHMVNAGVTKLLAGRDGLRLLSLNDHALFDKQQQLVTYR